MKTSSKSRRPFSVRTWKNIFIQFLYTAFVFGYQPRLEKRRAHLMVPVTKEKRRAHYTVHKSLTTVIPFSLPEPGNLSLSLCVSPRPCVCAVHFWSSRFVPVDSLSLFFCFLPQAVTTPSSWPGPTVASVSSRSTQTSTLTASTRPEKNSCTT